MTLQSIPPDVASAYKAFPTPAHECLMHLRGLVFEAAEALNVGVLTETLKWDEPAYLTAPRIGSTIRLGWKRKQPDHAAIYLNCQTTLIGDVRAALSDVLTFHGNRAILVPLEDPPPDAILSLCLGAALTYRRNKRQKPKLVLTAEL